MADPFMADRLSAWERWGPLAGVTAVVLMVVGVMSGAFGGPPPDEGTGQEWLSYFRENERQIYLSTLVFFIGIVLFVWFLTHLRVSLLAFEGESGHWTAAAFVSGMATAVMLVAITTPGFAGAFSNNALEPAAAQALGVAALVFFVGAQIFAAILLAATALVILRSRALPAWLAWASLVVAVLLFTPIGFLGLLIGFPLWVVAVSLLLWRTRDRRLAAAETRRP